MPADPVIDLDRVSRRFGRRPGIEAVRAISLRVLPGEVCAIAGPNGAGKSTLLALVLGFLHPSTGEVRIFGEPPRDFLRTGAAGYVPERVSLPGQWRVGALLHGLAALGGSAGARARAAAALAAMGLEAHAQRRVGELSRGLLQRVAIAQALLGEPRLLVLDEPTEGLDPLWRLRLRELIAERRAAGTAVVLASHDLAELERVATRVVLLDGGTIRSELAPGSAHGAGRYRIRVQAGGAAIDEVFPGARVIGEQEFEVEVEDATELSVRLRAWLERGGVLAGVQPLALEDRLRPELGEEG